MTAKARAPGIAAAVGEGEWQALADWVVRVTRDHWLRQQGVAPAARTNESRAPHPDDARPPKAERQEDGGPNTAPAHSVHQP